jgi:hypothetical protein
MLSLLSLLRLHYSLSGSGSQKILSYSHRCRLSVISQLSTLCQISTTFFSFLEWGEPECTWYVCQYLAWMIDDECGAIGGMRIGRGTRSIRRKPAPVPLYPLRIPDVLTWARTRAAAVRSQRLTARAMARP